MTATGTALYELREVVHEGARHRIQRARRRPNGPSVVVKTLRPEAATEEAVARLNSEYRLLRKLALPGVIRARELLPDPASPMLVLEDIGGTSLDRLPVPWPLDRFLELASGLAATLGALHDQGIIHRNVSPSNILFDPDHGHYRLIDFGLAEEIPEHAVAPQPPAALEGELAFISPEQTGRMNRSVDHRTDLYSLGATFYWLLTGALPFEAPDDMGLVHCHIAAEPVPPHERDPRVPETLSRIVQKLLAKMAEDRYQSGRGLAADLDRCLAGLHADGAVPLFEPGREDFTFRLQAPQRLYGRATEIARLFAAFERASGGGRELFLVAGYAGVGKTALVRETHRVIEEKNGYFIAGKFEQLQRNVPYFAWIQAFSGLVNRLLTESEARLSQWRDSLTAVLGGIGRVLTDVIPNLELIVGPQPEVPALGAAEAQNRFNYIFLQLVQALATREHPLVIFLDDLQWIDAASLRLLRALLTSTGVASLLVVGAYRDNEVDSMHPLTTAVEALRDGQARVELLTLEELPEEAVNELIAHSLSDDPARTRPLTRVLYPKTGGNPFFLLETLSALVERQAIAFDAGRRAWQWDISALARMEITDNVVALMVRKIQRLTPEVQRVLPLAASIGFRFNLDTLSLIAEQPEDVALERLQPALREGLVVARNRHYEFAHDRVQQAAYSLIPDGEKKSVHLGVGRLLFKHMSERDHDEQLFTVVDHLNMGAELLATTTERVELAQLNLRAGKKARASAAFSTAAKYFDAGVAMLEEESWRDCYELTLELFSRAAEAAGLSGDFARTDMLFAAVVRHARDPVDMVSAYMSRFSALSAQGRLPELVDCALEILARLGVRIPSRPTLEDIQRELKAIRTRLGSRAVQRLADLPACSDPRVLAIQRVLDLAQNSAYSGRPDLFAMLVFDAARTTIEHGRTPEAPHIFTHLALLELGLPGGDIEKGYELSTLALAFAEKERTGALALDAKATNAGMIHPYKEPIQETPEMLEPLYSRLKEVGDFEYAGYVACWRCCNSLLAGAGLVALEREMSAYYEDMRHIRAEVGCRWLAPFRQAAQNLLGRSACSWVVNGEAYDRPVMLRLIEETGNLAAQTALHVNTLMLCYLFGRYEEARVASDLAEGCKTGMVAMPIEPVWFFYDSLTRLALYPGISPAEKERYLERVAKNQAYLEMRARHAPMNFQHKWHLVEAERAAILGDGMKAIDHFDAAVAFAERNGFPHEQALAHERAGRFWLRRQKSEYARLHLSAAHRGYAEWQAFAKVKALESAYPKLLGRSTSERPGPDRGQLDLDTVMKATRAISSEIEMGRLLAEVMHLVIENAGAQDGFLLLEREGTWSVVAKGSIGRDEVEIHAPIGVAEDGLVSLAVVRFVARTKEIVVLDDAAGQGDFTRDPHIRWGKTRSLLCAPLLNRGRLIGILYLENNLMSRAFTPERRAVTEMLASQAAVSLETARVYEALRESEARYRRIVDTATEGVWLLDTNRASVFVNQRMAQMLGCSATEILARPAADFLFPEDLPDHERRMESRRRGESESYERRLRRKDGSAVWTLASATPILDEERRFTGSLAMFADITDRRRAQQELLRTNRFLRTLSRCNETLVHAVEELALLHDMCRVVVESGRFALAWVGYLEDEHTLKVMALVGAAGSDYLTEGTRIVSSDSREACRPAIRAVRSGEIQVIQAAADDPCAEWRAQAVRCGLGSGIALPLRASGALIGALSIAAAERDAFGPDEVTLLSELAGDLGYGIESLRVRRDREQFVERLRASMESTIKALSGTVELRDPYTAGHQRRVAELSALLGRRLGWSEERVQALFLAGMVHDIGKIAVPAEILSKPGRLSAAETALVRTHAEAGDEILRSVEFPWPIAEIVREHHERLDGSGYPRGLKGDEICPEARVLAVCDVVEAMSTHRPYRPKLGVEAALAFLEEDKGTLFDPAVVECCVKLLREDGFHFA